MFSVKVFFRYFFLQSLLNFIYLYHLNNNTPQRLMKGQAFTKELYWCFCVNCDSWPLTPVLFGLIWWSHTHDINKEKFNFCLFTLKVLFSELLKEDDGCRLQISEPEYISVVIASNRVLHIPWRENKAVLERLRSQGYIYLHFSGSPNTEWLTPMVRLAGWLWIQSSEHLSSPTAFLKKV